MAADPTIYDIARKAGVGIATVSRVLNGSERVAPATRQAVQTAMLALGYRPNRAARRLAVRGPNRPRIAALMPLFSTNFYFSVTRPMAVGLAAADMDLLISDIADREEKQRRLDRILAERSCEGLIICSMGIGLERQERLRAAGIPFIFVDYPMPGAPCATVDNVEGGRMAAQHLADGGSRRLALVTGPASAHAFRAREEGFRCVAGADAPVVRAGAVTREEGRTAAAALLDAHREIDGVFCVNDLLALGVLEELRRRGRRVPGQVQVIGFDDQPLMDCLGLSTIRQPMTALGEWAAQTIRLLVDDPASVIAPVRLDLSLVPRASTRPPRRLRAARGS